jgi:uncharacterized protein (DUF2235 family)
MARAARTVAEDGTPQITYYDAGVGAMNRAPDFRSKIVKRFENTLGGGWGAGFEVNIEEAYTFLSNNYEGGDEIFIFGFSRGASQARSLCGLIGWAGGFPPKCDAYYVPRIFSRYLEQRGEGSVDGLLGELNRRREERNDPHRVSIVPSRIKFLGVWDTVLALGWRIFARGGTTGPAHAFHTSKTPPANVDIIRHALAIDERRHDFQPEIWEESDSLKQRWFPGAHSNVGGGLIDDSLANAALKWMCDEAAKAGLLLDEDFLKPYRANPVGSASKKSAFYKFMDLAFWPFRGFKGVREVGGGRTTLDESVFKRLNADPNKHDLLGGTYRPANLMKYLADNPEYDGELDAEVQEEVNRHR